MKEFRLLPHNKAAYTALATMLDEKGHAAVIQATGTGKSYIAMQLIRDNPGSRILFITSYKANLTRFISDLGRYEIPAGNVVFALYRGLRNALDGCPFDIVIADEFHRLGAPGFGRDFKAVMERSPDARLAGFSATPVRHLDNQRDMAQELFDGDVAWELPLDDAILDGLLPAPDYITAAYSFEEDIAKAEKRLEDNGYSDEKKAKVLIEKARRTLENAGGLRQVFEDRLRNRNGKYIVFCRDWRNMKAMMELVDDWFGFCPERHVYRLYSNLRNHKDLDGFAADDSDALKLLFSIDMLNEGVHLTGIDGVIMLRPTQSPNVYFQQLGRALSVTAAKVPQVFDIVDNFAGMSIAQKFWTGLSQKAKSEGRPFAGRFEVAASQIGLLDIIRKLEELRMTWDDWYALACEYANGGLSSDGRKMVMGWISYQRRRYKLGYLADDKRILLEKVGFDIDTDATRKAGWNSFYEKAKLYYEENGPDCWKGFYSAGLNPEFGQWYRTQLSRLRFGYCSDEEAVLLSRIGIRARSHKEYGDDCWDLNFQKLVEFYKENGRLPSKDEGTLGSKDKGALGLWLKLNRKAFSDGTLDSRRRGLLGPLLADAEAKKKASADAVWKSMLSKASMFLSSQGHLPRRESQDPDEHCLGNWLENNRDKIKKGLLEPDKEAAISSLFEKRAEFHDSEKDREWYAAFNKIQEHMNAFGRYPSDSALYGWIDRNKKRLAAGLLPSDKAQLFSWLLAERERLDNAKWFEHLEEVRSSIAGNQPISRKPGTDGAPGIYGWLYENRKKLSQGLLCPDKANALMDVLGLESGQEHCAFVDQDAAWFQRLEEIKAFKDRHRRIPKKKDDRNWYGWLLNNRKKLVAGLLSPDKAKALSEVLGLDIPEDCPTE